MLWEVKHDTDCRNSFRWFLVNTVWVLVVIVQMKFYGFSESSKEKSEEENLQFGHFVSYKQQIHSLLHVFLKRTYCKAFFSSMGMRLFAKN